MEAVGDNLQNKYMFVLSISLSLSPSLSLSLIYPFTFRFFLGAFWLKGRKIKLYIKLSGIC